MFYLSIENNRLKKQGTELTPVYSEYIEEDLWNFTFFNWGHSASSLLFPYHQVAEVNRGQGLATLKLKISWLILKNSSSKIEIVTTKWEQK